MSKVKVVAALFAVLAFSALASGSASAASWKVNGTVLSGAAKLATTAENMENAKLTFGAISVTCKGKNLEGTSPQIESTNKGSSQTLKFSECTAAGENCTLVGTTISTVPVVAEVTTEPTAPADSAVFSPKTKNTFATLEFSGASCSIAGETQPVTGKAKVTAPTGQTSLAKQEIVANTASGELKVGLTAATLKGKALLKLESGLPFNFA